MLLKYECCLSYPALHHALVGFAGDIDLVHRSPQIIEQEGPVSCSEVHLPWLSSLGGAFLRSFVQYRPGYIFAVYRQVLLRAEEISNAFI